MSSIVENCLICAEKINREGSPRSLKERRADYAVTCSKRCSKVYKRVSHYIKSRLRTKNGK